MDVELDDTGSETSGEVFEKPTRSAKSCQSDTATRIPSQLGIKATFSRPVTAGRFKGDKNNDFYEDEEIDEVLLTELKEITTYNERVEFGYYFAKKCVNKATDSDNKPPPDIFADAAWDTDLESEEASDDDDDDLEQFYLNLCHKLGVVPASHFARHVEDDEIKLRHYGLGDGETQAIGEALMKILNIEKIDLGNNFMSGKGCKYLCRALMENHSLKDLSIAENRLGDESAEEITTMLTHNGTLQELNLGGNEFTDCSAEIFADCLEDCKLKSLDLSGNQFGETGGRTLGPAISANVYMEKLNLSWNRLRGPGAVALAKGLKDNMRISSVDLSWNGFGEDGGLAIADALMSNAVLKELNLSSNRLPCSVALKLAKAIAVNEALEVLQLRDNPITTTGAIALVTAINNSQVSLLRVLDLKANPVEYEFLSIVKELKKRREFEAPHGTILRSGNTSQDIGKPAIDIERMSRRPIMILKQHLVINDIEKVRKILNKKYLRNGRDDSITPDNLITCLLEVDRNLDNKSVATAVAKFQLDENQKISVRDIMAPP